MGLPSKSRRATPVRPSLGARVAQPRKDGLMPSIILELCLAVVQLGTAVVRWATRGKGRAFGRGRGSESVGDCGRGDVDPRVLLEPGDSLKAMLMRGNLPPAVAGALLRTRVRFSLASEPEADIDEILTLAAATHIGVRNRARDGKYWMLFWGAAFLIVVFVVLVLAIGGHSG